MHSDAPFLPPSRSLLSLTRAPTRAALPILSYYDDTTDCELSKALAILKNMARLMDLRPYLKENFGFRDQLRQIMQMDS